MGICYLYACHKPEGRSFHKSCRELKISQPTAWFLLQRIREGFSDWSGEPINLLNGEKMKGTVEVDEAYIGGRWRFMHYERKQLVSKEFYRRRRGRMNQDI